MATCTLSKTIFSFLLLHGSEGCRIVEVVRCRAVYRNGGIVDVDIARFFSFFINTEDRREFGGRMSEY